MEAPDSGYSWVVVVCCFYVHFAIFGIFRSAGVMYVAMLQNYDVTREEASWPISIAAGVFLITGPVAGISTHYISQRKACIIGAIIATLGIAGCYFAENITWINIFYGIIHGFGFGILATLITVTLNQYFVKYRATAIGFAFSGGSASSLVFPLIMEWLLENYSLRDSFLLLSGAVMNTLVAASLLRAPPWMQKPKLKQKHAETIPERRDSGFSISGECNTHTKSPASNNYQLAPQAEPEDSEIEENGDFSVFSDISPKKSADQIHSKKDSSEISENLNTVESNTDSALFSDSLSKCNSVSNSFEDSKSLKRNLNGNLGTEEPLICDKSFFVAPMKERKELIEKPKQYSEIQHSVTSILKNPIFYKIAFTIYIYFLGVHTTFMVIVDFAKDKGIPEEKGVYIISMFSLTDLIGRAGLGWVTDYNYITRKNMVCLSLTVLGFTYQLYPILDVLPGILAIAAVQGLAVGCSITLFFVIQVESMGLKNFTLVVGLTNFLNGVLSFLRPSIVGLFRDVIGSYNWMFHITGAITLMFALMWFIDSYRSKSTSPTACDEKA